MDKTIKAIAIVFVAIALFVAFETLVSGSDDGDDTEEEEAEPDYDTTVYYTLVSREYCSTRYDEEGNEIEKDLDSVLTLIHRTWRVSEWTYEDPDEDDLRWLCVTYVITTENPDPEMPTMKMYFNGNADSAATKHYYSVTYECTDTDFEAGEEVTVHVWYLTTKGKFGGMYYDDTWIET